MVKKEFQGSVEAIMRLAKNGKEYWMARDLQTILGYKNWQDFKNAIESAVASCDSAGLKAADWFREVHKPSVGGKGAGRTRQDYYLSRLGCYLIAMNGDSRKPEIGLAQAYFVVRTRHSELLENAIDVKRIEKRGQVREHNKMLSSQASRSGVKNQGMFHGKRYQGLYNDRLANIKKRKGVPKNKNLLDFVGFEELAANDFCITQTTRQLKDRGVNNEKDACDVTFNVGQEVRKTIVRLGNPMPETLPIETDIKKLERKQKRLLKSKK